MMQEERLLHCWQHLERWNEQQGKWETGTCFREDGHDGEHEFTPDSAMLIQGADELSEFPSQEEERG